RSRSDGGALSAARYGADDGAQCGASSHKFSRPPVGSNPFSRFNARGLRGQSVTLAIHHNRLQIHDQLAVARRADNQFNVTASVHPHTLLGIAPGVTFDASNTAQLAGHPYAAASIGIAIRTLPVA